MKIFIFDVSNMFYRGFYSSNLTTSYGFPVNGMHGFLRIVHSIMRDHKPELVAFAMEGGGVSKRKQIEPLYKANRQEPPEDLTQQLEILPELMQVFGFPTFRFPEYEADDTIATLVNKALAQGLEPVIVSSDKDFCQLVRGPVKMWNVSKDEMVDEVGVYHRYGVRADQFVDYLAIVGDTSDNIQGVKGIGAVGAQKLIATYHSLDGIYQNLASIKGANQGKLIASKDQVYKAQQLVQFMEVPMVADLQTVCNWAGPRRVECLAFLRKYEFREIEQMVFGAQVVNLGGVEIGVRR